MTLVFSRRLLHTSPDTGVSRPPSARTLVTMSVPEGGDTVPKLSESIEADVPPAFADREWGKYMIRQFYENQSRAAAAIGDEFADGVVKFEPDGSASTKVTVELVVEPEPGVDQREDVSRAQKRVESVLEAYRKYVVRRCEQTHCRNN
jgi:hypothetical protein